MRATLVTLCVVALALTSVGWTKTERGTIPGPSGLFEPQPATPSPIRKDGGVPRSVSAAAKRWKPNRAWLHDALCVYRHENGGYGWHANTGNGYYGGMQFLASTWRRAGGSGYPHRWAAREQLYRAWRIWRMYPGGSWVEWGTAGRCGLR